MAKIRADGTRGFIGLLLGVERLRAPVPAASVCMMVAVVVKMGFTLFLRGVDLGFGFRD